MNAYDDVICGISYFILSTLTFIQISNYSQKICDNTILKKHSNTDMNSSSESAYMQLIGNTPLIELKSLSKLTNCRILVKVESANPGGSGTVSYQHSILYIHVSFFIFLILYANRQR